MATEDLHDLTGPVSVRKVQPIQRSATPPVTGTNATARAVRSEAVASSHNTFRPDIYRVSEGYLN